jgi:ribonuclease T2
MIRSNICAVAVAIVMALSAGVVEARHSTHHAAPQSSSEPSGQAGVFDYYLLTLSWSPTYCLTHTNDSNQCGHKGFGFVLHGLWPQYTAGGYPESCDSQNRLTPEAVNFGKTIFPSPKLIDHEWGKHGTCSGLDALSYFQTADRARTSVKVPAPMESPAQTRSMTAADIASSFISANPGMPANALVVACSGPELAEVRVCMDRNLAPTACGKGVKTSCRSGPIRLPAAR